MKPAIQYTAHALDAERAVLGSILIDPSVLSIASDALHDDDFFTSAHQLIFETMKKLDASGQTIDMATIGVMLSSNSLFNESGGVMYLSDLMAQIPSACFVKRYCARVRNDAMRRKIQALSLEIMTQTNEPITDCAEYAQMLKDRIDEIAGRAAEQPWSMFEDVTKDAMTDVLSIQSGQMKGVDTGFIDIDRKMSGLRPGSLTIVAARPAMGKTAFALNIVRNAAIDNGISTAIFSLEMTSKELALRMLSSLSGVDSTSIRNATLSDVQWNDLFKAVEKYKGAPVVIDETPGISISSIRDRAKRMKAERGIKLIVVDYLQLMTSSSKRVSNREQEVADISRGLKNLAKELELPIICLAQLNRAVDARTDKRPFLSDLRESGSIEQDADNILFIHREDYYEKDKSKKTNKAEIIIAKQRAGSTGTITLLWNGATTTFSNYTEDRY